jgi:protein-L-isoaspartate O-methyltransferase
VGDRNLQRVVRVTRTGTTFTSETMLACRFVPLLGAEGWTDD